MNARLAAAMLLFLGCAAMVRSEVTVSFGTESNRFDMDFITIGNPGNPADVTGLPSPVGSVGYVYLMGRYEVSRAMVDLANAAGGLAITLDTMSFTTDGPRPEMPATGVSWNEAARFVNWLNTSQGFQPAYRFEFQPREAGYLSSAKMLLWQPSDPGYNAANPFRNSQARFRHRPGCRFGRPGELPDRLDRELGGWTRRAAIRFRRPGAGRLGSAPVGLSFC